MNERMHFIRLHQRGQHSVSELCRRFGVSRKTGYKWQGRDYADGGCSAGMRDRSRRPHTHSRAVPGWIEEAIVQARKQRPHWGPKKLPTSLVRSNPAVEPPATSHFAVGRVRMHRTLKQATACPPASSLKARAGASVCASSASHECHPCL